MILPSSGSAGSARPWLFVGFLSSSFICLTSALKIRIDCPRPRATSGSRRLPNRMTTITKTSRRCDGSLRKPMKMSFQHEHVTTPESAIGVMVRATTPNQWIASPDGLFDRSGRSATPGPTGQDLLLPKLGGRSEDGRVAAGALGQLLQALVD